MQRAAAYPVVNLQDCWQVEAGWTGVPKRNTTIYVPTMEGGAERRLVNLRPSGASLLRFAGIGLPRTEAEMRRWRLANVLPDDDGHGIRFQNDALRHDIANNRILSTDSNIEIVKKRLAIQLARSAFRGGAQVELDELNDLVSESPLYVAFRHPDSPDRIHQLGIARLAGFDFDHNNHDFTMEPLVYSTVQMSQVEAGDADVVPLSLPNPRDTMWPYAEAAA